MKKWVLLAALAPCASFGDGSWGTYTYPELLVPELQRIGPSALADSPTGQFSFALWPAHYGLRAKSIWFHVADVHVPGTVALTVGLPDAGTYAFSRTVAPGWNAWDVPPGLGPMFDFGLVPDAGVEFSLNHLTRHNDFDPQTGGFLDPIGGIWRYRTTPGSNQTTAVVTLTGGLDRRAVSAGCLPAETEAVTGNPYVRWFDVPIGSGQTQRIVFGHPIPDGTAYLAANGARFSVGNVPATGVFVAMLPDGGELSPHAVAFAAPESSVAFSGSLIALAVPDAGHSQAFAFRLATDGGAAWRMYDVGPDLLDPCHPVVRATFGGDLARAVGHPPGSDFAFRIQGGTTSYCFSDFDGDGFKLPNSGHFGDPTNPCLLADAGDDCSDSDPSVHPGAPEHCDGIDSDCDGTEDSNDQLVGTPACEKQVGVCAGAQHVPQECVGGTWAMCSPTTYGPAFSSVESACDGLDNDCNGQVDEGLTPPLCSQQLGVCAGSRAPLCSNGIWVSCSASSYGPRYEPVEVSCDQRDNDCNGHVDDGLIGPLCPLQLGICANSRSPSCVAGAWATCTAATYGATYESNETACDHRDNDCDGRTDAEDPDLARMTPCPLQRGVCAGAEHVTACDEALTACAYGPLYEADESTCDHRDNDCDGQIDEGCPPATPPANPRPCGCSAGPGALALVALLATAARSRRTSRATPVSIVHRPTGVT